MAQVGSVLQGKLDAYEIEEIFVSGRFGHTFLARRVSDKEDVIVKMIRLDRKADWQMLDLFERESERLRTLNHRSIAPYLDAVVVQGEDQTELGLVQAYVTTPSLRQWREGRGLVDMDRCLDWFEKALEALVYLHEQDPPLVHGDIDAGNILISDHHEIQLVDFATVRQMLLSAPTLASGLAVGSLDYAPMEQLLGKIFPASDLYALAMTFLAVMSKTEPPEFPVDGMRPSLEELLPYDTPRALHDLIHQMTEPDPQHRLSSARIALERLRAARLDEEGRGEEVGVKAQGFDLSREEPVVSSGAEAIPCHQHRRDQHLVRLVKQVSPVYQDHPLLETWTREFQPDYDRVHAFGIAADGVTMVVAHHRDAYVLHTSTLDVRGEAEFNELARRIAVSRDGQRIAILTGFEELLFYDVNVSLWQKHKIIVDGMWPGNAQLVFSPDGSHVAISDDDQVNLYAWKSAALIKKWEVDGQYGLTFAPGGEFILASGAQGTSVLRASGASQVDQLEWLATASSPDGEVLAAISQSKTRHRLTIGTVQRSASTPSFGDDAISIDLPDWLDERRVHMLKFSPDQRWLFAGCAQGGFVVIDVQGRKVLDFKDTARAMDREHTKLFEVGFSPDSSRLLLHGTLAPDTFGADRLGVLASWKLPSGEFLGSLLWLDGEMGIASSQGFHGEVREAQTTGFSSDRWERPDLAAAIFNGKDVGDRLSSKERAAHREFMTRYAIASEVAHCYRPALDAPRLANLLSGLSHVAPAVFESADERYRKELMRENRLMEVEYLDEFESAAYSFDIDRSHEEMIELHHDILSHPEKYETREPVSGAVTSSRAPETASTRAGARQSAEEAGRLDEPEEPSSTRERVAGPGTGSLPPRKEYVSRSDRAPEPYRRPGEPLSTIHRGHEHDDAPHAPTAASQDGASSAMRFFLASILGFGAVLLFVVLAMQTLPTTNELFFLLAAGLALTLAMHFGLLKQLLG